jgi:DNA-binding transcriptional LysR family regulator
MLEQLEGRCLLTFLAVLEEGSFSRAAERLGYVQSTVTAHIRQLEEACGKKLFNRLPRGVEPTAAGLEAAGFARRFVQLGEALSESMASLDEPRGNVRVQALEAFCTAHMTPVLEPFARRYPRIRLQLESGILQEIADAVASGRVELGLVPADPGRGELLFTPLCEERLVWVGSPQLAQRWREAGWDALGSERVIGFGGRCLFHTLAEQQLHGLAQSYGARYTAAPMVFASAEMIRQAVRCGLGFTLLPESAVAADLAAGALAELPLPSFSPARADGGSSAAAAAPAPAPRDPLLLTHGLIRARGRELATPARLFAEATLQHFRPGAALG